VAHSAFTKYFLGGDLLRQKHGATAEVAVKAQRENSSHCSQNVCILGYFHSLTVGSQLKVVSLIGVSIYHSQY
jgi:hypothetical protein